MSSSPTCLDFAKAFIYRKRCFRALHRASSILINGSIYIVLVWRIRYVDIVYVHRTTNGLGRGGGYRLCVSFSFDQEAIILYVCEWFLKCLWFYVSADKMWYELCVLRILCDWDMSKMYSHIMSRGNVSDVSSITHWLDANGYRICNQFTRMTGKSKRKL